MSQSLNGLSSMATRGLLAELAESYAAAGHGAVAFRSVGGVEAAKTVRSGEAVDVVVLASGVMEALEREGHLVAGSRVDVVRSSMAVAVRAGAPKPAIGSEAALREAVAAADRLCYSTGPSGDQLKAMIARWGLADALADRLVQAPPGVPVGSLVAEGGGLGFQQLSEFTGVVGIAIVGPLPPELGTETVFTAGIGARSARPEDARAFVVHLGSEATAAAKERLGFARPG